MSERNLKQLQLILKNLDGRAWSRLELFHLSVFRSMYARRINYPFLYVVVEFWDSKDHVFRFNTVELYPLPEEFKAILGSQSDSACQIATPPLEIPDLHLIQYQMVRMFKFLPQTSLYYLSGAEISMKSWLESMVSTDKSEVYWPRLIALYLYSQFLLISPSGDCDPKILSILDRVEAEKNPFPLILVETIQSWISS